MDPPAVLKLLTSQRAWMGNFDFELVSMKKLSSFFCNLVNNKFNFVTFVISF